MEKYEVTKAQWDAVASVATANGYDIYVSSASGKATNHPVQGVTWYDCVKWCNARSEKEGLVPCYTVGGVTYKTGKSDNVVLNKNVSGYRLPTEAEWEKAARGGLIGKRFPWGDTISHSQANYYGNPSGYSYDLGPEGYNLTYATGYPCSSPVGSFAANGYGLYDMQGNVSEWCWDWYGPYGSGSLSDPTGPASGSYRVFRGADWHNSAYSCRVAYRDAVHPGHAILIYDPEYNGPGFGFRCARSSVP